jgi:hypothetical protein
MQVESQSTKAGRVAINTVKRAELHRAQFNLPSADSTYLRRYSRRDLIDLIWFYVLFSHFGPFKKIALGEYDMQWLLRFIL